MSLYPQQVARLFVEFEELIAYSAMYPGSCDEGKLLRLNFQVCTALKQYPGVRRSQYLSVAMEILKIPLCNNLHVPWEKIKELDTLRRVKLQDPLIPLSEFPTASASMSTDRSKSPGLEAREPGTMPLQMPQPHSSDILKEKCQNCIRLRQKECKKSRGCGACDQCSSKCKRCNLTEAVWAHWKSIGDRRSQSRSRSTGPKKRIRASSIEHMTSQYTHVPVGAGGPDQVDSSQEHIGAATPAPCQHHTDTARIAALEGSMLEVRNQMAKMEREHSRLMLFIEECRKDQSVLQLQVEDYDRDHISTKAVIREIFSITRQVKQKEAER